MYKIINTIKNNPLILLNSLFIFLVIEYFFLGKFSFIQIHDFADDIFPRYIALWRDFLKDGYQSWNSDIGPGVNRLSNLVFYDNFLSLLIAALPAWLAYQIYIVLTSYLGVFGYYKLNTTYFAHHKILSVIFAILIPTVIAFSNSTGLSCGIQFYPFFIYIIYKIDRQINNTFIKLTMLLTAIYITSISMSFTLGFVYLAPFTLFWLLIIDKIKPSTVIITILGFCLIFLAHYNNITSLLSNAMASHRSEFATMSSNEGRLYFFSQAPIIILSIIFILKNRLFNIRVLLVLTTFLLITIGDTVLNYIYDLLFNQNALASLKISRISFFSTSLLGFVALSIAKILNKKERKVLIIIAVLNLLYICINIKLMNAEMWIRQGNYVANFETENLENLRKSDSSLYRVATIYGVTHANMLAKYGFESADGYSPMYPLIYKHYWSQILLPFLKSDISYNEYFYNWGSRFYLLIGEPKNNNNRYARFKSITFAEFYNLNLLSLANVKYIFSHQPILDNRLTLISDAINSAGMSNMDKIKLRIKENFVGRKSLYIYKNDDYFDRIFTINNTRFFINEVDCLNFLSKASIDELRNSAALYKEDRAKLAQFNFTNSKKSSIVITKYSPSEISFKINANGDTMVVLSQYFDSNWKCSSNGKNIDIYRANVTFTALAIKGKHISYINCKYV